MTNKSAREELGTWKVKNNWNNCLLQRWICYKYYAYSQQNHFAGSTIASLNQLLHNGLMWNHDILDLQQIFTLQIRKLWGNSPFAGPIMKACIYTDKKLKQNRPNWTLLLKDYKKMNLHCIAVPPHQNTVQTHNQKLINTNN